MSEETQEATELDQGKAAISDRHANFDPSEEPRGFEHAGKLQQAHQPDNLHCFNPLHARGFRDQPYEVPWDNRNHVDDKPRPQIPLHDFVRTVLQHVAIVGLLWVHHEELKYQVHKEEAVDKRVQEEEEVELRLDQGQLNRCDDRNPGQTNHRENIPMLEELATLRIDDQVLKLAVPWVQIRQPRHPWLKPKADGQPLLDGGREARGHFQ
mmetsp:Transcript_53880/g.175260  ORF Transcript_53880/g.175260 Transcript_53880/m.175260 type:complete len:210 (-) Transcript_53880:501-1130(-)